MKCRKCVSDYDRSRRDKIEGYFCSGRFTIKRHPDKYVKPIKCPHCGSMEVYSVEDSRIKELSKQDTHTCDLIPFPHRNGSSIFCVNHNDFGREYTEEEQHQYQGMLETPRSGFA